MFDEFASSLSPYDRESRWHVADLASSTAHAPKRRRSRAVAADPRGMHLQPDYVTAYLHVQELQPQINTKRRVSPGSVLRGKEGFRNEMLLLVTVFVGSLLAFVAALTHTANYWYLLPIGASGYFLLHVVAYWLIVERRVLK